LAIDGKFLFKANLARALLRRGDRTEEARSLLDEVARLDDRPEWRNWASLQRARIPNEP